jgi:hypothetical protein
MVLPAIPGTTNAAWCHDVLRSPIWSGANRPCCSSTSQSLMNYLLQRRFSLWSFHLCMDLRAIQMVVILFVRRLLKFNFMYFTVQINQEDNTCSLAFSCGYPSMVTILLKVWSGSVSNSKYVKRRTDEVFNYQMALDVNIDGSYYYRFQWFPSQCYSQRTPATGRGRSSSEVKLTEVYKVVTLHCAPPWPVA